MYRTYRSIYTKQNIYTVLGRLRFEFCFVPTKTILQLLDDYYQLLDTDSEFKSKANGAFSVQAREGIDI